METKYKLGDKVFYIQYGDIVIEGIITSINLDVRNNVYYRINNEDGIYYEESISLNKQDIFKKYYESQIRLLKESIKHYEDKIKGLDEENK